MKMMTNFSKRHSRGFTLLEVLAQVAVVTILIYASSRLLIGYAKSQAHLQWNGQEQDLRRYLLTSLDCATTATGVLAACTAGNLIVGKKSDGSTLIGKPLPVTKFGKNLGVRLRCTNAPDLYEMTVETRRSVLDPSSGVEIPLLDPLTRQPEKWKPIQSIPFFCPKGAP